jgi:hypothetical protein
MKTVIPSNDTVKWPEPKPIDWTKFIEPMHQDFETKNGITAPIFLNKENYEIRNSINHQVGNRNRNLRQ